MDSQLNIDYENFQVEENDIFLFMTDGVYEFVSEEILIKIINETNS